MTAAPRKAKGATAHKKKTGHKHTVTSGKRRLTKKQVLAGFAGKAAQKRAGG